MQDQTHPDIAISVAKKSEEYACENCGECFRHWFAPMDHAIGHHHREYRVTAEARLQTMQQKPAKEKLETEELRKINQFPDQECRAKIGRTVVNL